MEPFGRQPPRFVPTLTDVVPQGLPLHKPSQLQEPIMDDFLRPDVEQADARDSDVADALQSSSTHSQRGENEQLGSEPAFTEEADTAAIDVAPVESYWQPPGAAAQAYEVQAEVWDASAPVAELPELVVPEMERPSAPSVDLEALQEVMVARILARVQPQLEAQLREVVADVVSQHTEVMARSLHHAVEEVVQQAVIDAMEQEKIQAKLGFDAYR